jgi:hypothetical protein
VSPRLRIGTHSQRLRSVSKIGLALRRGNNEVSSERIGRTDVSPRLRIGTHSGLRSVSKIGLALRRGMK